MNNFLELPSSGDFGRQKYNAREHIKILYTQKICSLAALLIPAAVFNKSTIDEDTTQSYCFWLCRNYGDYYVIDSPENRKLSIAVNKLDRRLKKFHQETVEWMLKY